MAKQLDPVIMDVLKKHGFDKKAVWDCHGTWVIYHNVLEKIAAKEGVVFSQPYVCSSSPDNVAICVTGDHGKLCEWSIGEASPKNCKNAYPWAMAEKRAKDRVILKLIGLAGLVYSEEEAYDLKQSGKGVWEAPKWEGDISKTETEKNLREYFNKIFDTETMDAFKEVNSEYSKYIALMKKNDPDYFTSIRGEESSTYKTQIDVHKDVIEQMEPPA